MSHSISNPEPPRRPTLPELRRARALEFVLWYLEMQQITAEGTAVVGSSYYADTLDKDVDVLVLVSDNTFKSVAWATLPGFIFGGSSRAGSDCWVSLKGEHPDIGCVNLLVCDDAVFFHNFKRAANICKRLGLTDKAQVVAVHEELGV